jgi:hypothetical protein
LGEEVVEALAGGLVGAGVFGCEAVGLDEGGGGFADVAALGTVWRGPKDPATPLRYRVCRGYYSIVWGFRWSTSLELPGFGRSALNTTVPLAVEVSSTPSEA